MTFKAVLFDLDGTLIDTIEDIRDSINSVLTEMSLPTHDIEEYKQFVGAGVEILMHRVLPQDHQDKDTIEKFKKLEVARRKSLNKSRLYNGVPEMLSLLSLKKIRTAILSNRPEASVNDIVERFLARWKFDVIMGAGGNFPLKPDPLSALEIAGRLKLKPARFVYLGDSDIDILTAQGAGMYPVGALWGFRSAKELQESGAKKFIERPLQLLDMFS